MIPTDKNRFHVPSRDREKELLLVLVQGVIAEVDAQTASQLGIQWGTGGGNQSAANMGINGVVTSSYAFSGGGLGVGEGGVIGGGDGGRATCGMTSTSVAVALWPAGFMAV